MKPKELTDSEIVFGKIEGLMPSYHSIPDEFKRTGHPWCQWQSNWFFEGLKSMPSPKKDIDLDMAIRHLTAIQRSFRPKHEHKMAAVAYLASQWFEKE